MRIPAEAIPFYLNENTKAFADGKKAEPVDGSAKLRAALSYSLSKQHQGFEADQVSAEESAEHAEHEHNHQRNTDQRGDEERRQYERRKEKHPVLIDTRLRPRHRRSAPGTAIDIKV